MPSTTAIIIGLCVVLAAYVIWLFNRLISLRVRASNAWADIDVQLKRRADLVPPLVETVRGHAAHDFTAQERLLQARS
ncbi:MAG: LemA family protein [Phycisphaerales bacterium]|nr:LemA family protein [Phycisphaerales bacterium]